jgi:hydrogenase nickel incorporation protein HypB
MCETCGCSDDSQAVLTDLESGAVLPLQDVAAATDHDLARGPDGTLVHAHHSGRIIRMEQELLAKNRLLAARNRGWLAARNVLALNLLSSPGAGKTTLLERTIRDLGGELAISIIEGDQATLHDARRIQATGCKVVQVNTGAGCHLDADMTGRSLRLLNPRMDSIVVIENVGNRDDGGHGRRGQAGEVPACLSRKRSYDPQQGRPPSLRSIRRRSMFGICSTDEPSPPGHSNLGYAG